MPACPGELERIAIGIHGNGIGAGVGLGMADVRGPEGIETKQKAEGEHVKCKMADGRWKEYVFMFLHSHIFTPDNYRDSWISFGKS